MVVRALTSRPTIAGRSWPGCPLCPPWCGVRARGKKNTGCGHQGLRIIRSAGKPHDSLKPGKQRRNRAMAIFATRSEH